MTELRGCMVLISRRSRHAARAAAVVLGGLVGVLSVSPAWADTTAAINPAHLNTQAGAFDQNCGDFQGGASPTLDGWVFVLTDEPRDFVSLSLTFSGVVYSIPGDGTISPPSPATSKAFIQVPAGSTLQAASAVVTGTGESKMFNVTHTCKASGGSSPSPKPSTSTSASARPTPSGAAGTGGGGSLRSPVVTAAAVTLGLLGVGAGLVVARRREGA
ncbi:hypothetical protein R8Z50_25790 [Longispora sp. K20-0274]|uniref:hypothetical protein n=1 Tax=Longispora sp. K20-0274 TaxID=3088255 RepID=UPI00399AA927